MVIAIALTLPILGCAAYERYCPRPQSSAAVALRLETVTHPSEMVQPVAAPLPILTDLENISVDDGLSPEEAAYVAVISNPGLRTIRDQRGIARSQIIEAGILPNPQFAYSSDSPSVGNTIGTLNADSQSLSWDVSKLNPRESKIRSANLSLESVSLDVARQEWLIAQQARQAVFDLVALRQQIDKLQQAETVLQENLKLVEKAEQEGNLTLVELSAAKSASALLRTSILATVQLEQGQRLQLKRILGLAASAPMELQSGIELPSKGEPPDAYELYPLLDFRFDLVASRRSYQSQDQA